MASSYNASAYSPELPGGLIHGLLRLSDDGATADFLSQDGELVIEGLTTQELEIELGGFNNEQVILRHPSKPSCHWLCSDKELLRSPLLATHPTLAKRAEKLHRRRDRTPWGLLTYVALIILTPLVLALGGVWFFQDDVARLIVALIPAQWEAAAGESHAPAGAQPLTPSSKHFALIQEIDQRMVAPLLGRRYTYSYSIIESPEMNAYATMGGKIFINTGLLEKVKRPEQLAGVLAHEIAHNEARHGLRTIVGSMTASAAYSLVTGDASWLVQASDLLTEHKFSREMESEADALGWDYMVAAEIDPAGMIEFFRSLQDASGDSLNLERAVAWFSTHPLTEDRIAELEPKLKALGDRRWKALLSKVNP
jgi:beta-barrel assembly-enhancing protease